MRDLDYYFSEKTQMFSISQKNKKRKSIKNVYNPIKYYIRLLLLPRLLAKYLTYRLIHFLFTNFFDKKSKNIPYAYNSIK